MDIHDKTQIKASLRQSFGSIIYAMNEMSEEEFHTPVTEGKWSPSDIIGHLILSTKPLSKALSMPKKMLEATFGVCNRTERSYTQTLDRYYDRLSDGVQAPATFTFRNAHDKTKDYMISKFNNELRLLLETIDDWSERDLSHYVLPHPAIGKMTIREMLFFTNFHTLHHLKQVAVLSPAQKLAFRE